MKKLPIGLEDFRKLRENDCYYVDKTNIIKKLLTGNTFEVELVMRPRRFGKTLTMSTLENFFDIEKDSKEIFAGLNISKEKDLCNKYMNKYPTVFLTLKGVEGLKYEVAYDRFKIIVSDVFKRYLFLLDSDKVNEFDKATFKSIASKEADFSSFTSCFLVLTRMLSDYYNSQVILLIDEYDVPLAKASENGYYTEMLDVIRTFLGSALKTNPYLKLAVVTGCLRISKESIFTGLNNLAIDDITGGQFEEYIGFTPLEVEKMLTDAGLSDHIEEVQKWYDGYLFGETEMYCPWSVVNHINALQNNNKTKPKNYWANTSHNGIIYNYININGLDIQEETEKLLSGGTITTAIEENITYNYLTSTSKNFYSLLYLSGYLTKAKEQTSDEEMTLRIPNEEVRSTFKKSILDYYNDYIEKTDRSEIYKSLWEKDSEKATKLISDILFKTISYYDYEESYYHSFIAGLFAGDKYIVESNKEYGTGRPDIVVKDKNKRQAMIIEIKYAKEKEDIEKKKKEGLEQFENNQYLEGISEDYYTKIGYVAVFYKKRCYVFEAN